MAIFIVTLIRPGLKKPLTRAPSENYILTSQEIENCEQKALLGDMNSSRKLFYHYCAVHMDEKAIQWLKFVYDCDADWMEEYWMDETTYRGTLQTFSNSVR